MAVNTFLDIYFGNIFVQLILHRSLCAGTYVLFSLISILAVHSISENLLKLPASSSPYAKWPVTNGKITKLAHTKDILPYCSLDSTIPHRKSLKQRQHGGEEGQDSSISFLPVTHTAHTSITARQLQIQAEPWIQSVTGL